MKNVNRLYKFVGKFIESIAMMVLLLLSTLTFFFQSRVSMEKQTMEKVSFHNNSILVYLFLLCLVVGIFIGRKKLETINSKKLYLFLATILFAMGMILVLGAGTDLRADALEIYKSAKAISKGNFSSLARGNYLFHYPHQLGMVTYEWFLLKLVNNIEVFFFVNLIFVLFNIYVLGQISYIFFKDQFIQNITLILAFLFFPQLFFILFAYGTIPGFSMLLAALYFQLLFLRDGQKRFFLLYIIFACFSCLLKNNYLIGVLTSCVLFIIYSLKEKKWKFILCICISLLCVSMSGKMLNWGYENLSKEKVSSGQPKLLWVAMGLRDESSILGGWYDGYNKKTYTDFGYDNEVASDEAIKSIKNSINRFIHNPGYAVDFFQDKIESTWCDPLFQSIWSGPLEDCGQTMNDLSLKRIYSEGICHSIVRDFCGAELIFIYFTTLTFVIMAFRSLDSSELLIGIVFLLGGFLFHLFWETKSQYVYPYVFLLIPYSAYVFSKGCNNIQIIFNRKTIIHQRRKSL